MPTVALLRCWFQYTDWCIGKQRHSHTNHLSITVQCPTSAFTTWHVNEKSVLLPVSTEPQKTRDKVSNLLTYNEFGESSPGCIPMSSSAEICYSVCLPQKMQRKVYLQVAADTWNLCLLQVRQPNAQAPHAQTNVLMGLLLEEIINSYCDQGERIVIYEGGLQLVKYVVGNKDYFADVISCFEVCL